MIKPMIVITTSISTSVKPLSPARAVSNRRFIIERLLIAFIVNSIP